jgi:hypothetical protein
MILSRSDSPPFVITWMSVCIEGKPFVQMKPEMFWSLRHPRESALFPTNLAAFVLFFEPGH